MHLIVTFIIFFNIIVFIGILFYLYLCEQYVDTYVYGSYVIRRTPIINIVGKYVFFMCILLISAAFFMVYYFFESKIALVLSIFFLSVVIVYFNIKQIDNIFYYFYPPLTLDDKILIFNKTLISFILEKDYHLSVRFIDVHPLIMDLNSERDIIEAINNYLNERLIIDKASGSLVIAGVCCVTTFFSVFALLFLR